MIILIGLIILLGVCISIWDIKYRCVYQYMAYAHLGLLSLFMVYVSYATAPCIILYIMFIILANMINSIDTCIGKLGITDVVYMIYTAIIISWVVNTTPSLRFIYTVIIITIMLLSEIIGKITDKDEESIPFLASASTIISTGLILYLVNLT